MDSGRLKILFVSAEMSPFAKTGGLADVAGSLPAALAGRGHDVRAVMPKYRQIKEKGEYITEFPIDMNGQVESCEISKTGLPYKLRGETKELPVYFAGSRKYFDRDGIYGHYDDAERFLFFCRAILDMLPRIGFKPDIIHCNDWHTGPVCLLLKEKYSADDSKGGFYSRISTVYTIHNLEYQGNFPKEVIPLMDMGFDIFTSEKAEFYGMFSFMKAGLVYSDLISTVSGVYAEEIQTPQYGEKLEGVLSNRRDDLYGILNGVNYEEFNPETDKAIVRNYGVSNFRDKKENKAALQKEMGLPLADVPVIGLVSRLSGQKGLNLILEKIGDILRQDIQFVMLGAGEDYYREQFNNAALRYPDKFAVSIGFNADLACKIYAGSDMFLMPSRFEPCGLGQLISLRYGTIPIVRATGGLAETIRDYTSDNTRGNGFSFRDFSSDAMLDAVERGLKVYREMPGEWDKLIVRALKADFSWERSAEKYECLYMKAIKLQK